MTTHQITLINEYTSTGFEQGIRHTNQLSSSQDRLSKSLTTQQQKIITNHNAIRQLQALQKKGIVLNQSQKRHLTNLTHGYRTMGGQMSKLSTGTSDLLTKFTKFRWALVNAAMAAGLAYGAFSLLIKPSIELESSLAEVRKTTGFTRKETKDLGKSMIELSRIMPISAKELADIAAVAGQLGIKGVNSIKKFTTTVALMASATNMSAEESARALAKISNAFGLPIDNALSLASVINQLENTTAATSEEIVKGMERLGAASKAVGLSAENASAVIATLVAGGMGGQRAGTRFSRVLIEMQKNMDGFAKIAQHAGVKSLTEFKEIMKKDVKEALLLVLKGIQNNKEEVGHMGIAYDVAGSVAGHALATLTNNIENFEEAMRNAENVSGNMSALIKESGDQAETATKQWQMLMQDISIFGQEGWVANVIGNLRLMAKVSKELREEQDKTKKSTVNLLAVGAIGQATSVTAQGMKIWEEQVDKYLELAKELDVKKPLTRITEIADRPTLVQSINEIEKEIVMLEDLKKKKEEVAQADKEVEKEKKPLSELIEEYVTLKEKELDVIGKSPEVMAKDSEAVKNHIQLIKDLYEIEYPGITNALSRYFSATHKATSGTSILNKELGIASDQLSDVKQRIKETNASINNLLRRRWKISGISETEISHLIKQQELELNKAKFATLGLGSAEQFLRSASLLTTDSINSQSSAMQRLIAITETGEDRFDAWKNALSETIRELMISSQDIDRDVTNVIHNAQTELLSITRFDKEKGDQFTAMENNIDALGQAQGIFFGSEQEQLKYSEMLREDRINGMNESAEIAISGLESERNVLSLLIEEEQKWIRQQKSIREEIEATRNARSGGGGYMLAGSGTKGDPYADGPIYGSTKALKAQLVGKYGDFISRPGQSPVGFSAEDIIVGMKDISQLSGGKGNNINININGYGKDPHTLAQEIVRNISALA